MDILEWTEFLNKLHYYYILYHMISDLFHILSDDFSFCLYIQSYCNELTIASDNQVFQK
jgi:hypothetical protein